MNLRAELKKSRLLAEALVSGDGKVEKRYSMTVREAIEAIAKAKGELSDEQRATLQVLAKMDTFKADAMIEVVIRNDPWQWPTTESEVPIGSERNSATFPQKTLDITVKEAGKTEVGKAIKCPSCGASMEDGATKCTECGAKLEADDEGEGKKPFPGAAKPFAKSASGVWPGDIAAAKFDKSSGNFKSQDLPWGRDEKKA